MTYVSVYKTSCSFRYFYLIIMGSKRDESQFVLFFYESIMFNKE